MNKLLLFILLTCCPVLAVAEPLQDTLVPDQDTVITAATFTPAYTTHNFKPDFKQRYKSDDFNYTEVAGQKSLWDRFWEWVAKLLGNNKPASVKDSNNWGDIFLKALGVLAILAAIYFIARAVLHQESYWIFGRSRKGITIQDAEAENIHAMNFEQLIEQTKTTGDYRLAVRYYYLLLLKKLSLREIINWHWDKTNSDYLYEIKDGTLRKNFEYLSYVYDHSWYGDFPIDEKSFAKAEKAFLKTINTL